MNEQVDFSDLARERPATTPGSYTHRWLAYAQAELPAEIESLAASDRRPVGEYLARLTSQTAAALRQELRSPANILVLKCSPN